MFRLKNHIQFNTFLFIIVLLLVSILSTAASAQETANKLFKAGNYAEALPMFEELNRLYTSDANFQYSYGVCLTETSNAGQKAKKLLLQASQADVPNNVFYYIGKNYQAEGNFEMALSYYRRFEEQASKKELKASDYKALMASCEEQKIPFEVLKDSIQIVRPVNFIPNIESTITEEEDTTKAIETVETSETQTKEEQPTTEITDDADSIVDLHVQDSVLQTENRTDTLSATTEIIQEPVSSEELVKNEEIEEKPLPDFPDTTFNFTLASEIWYCKIDQFRTTEGRQAFINGWNQAQILDTILQKTKQLRSVYENTPEEDIRSTIASQVIDLEQQSIQLKMNSDANFLLANETETKYWLNASNEEISKLKTENDSIRTSIIALKQTAQMEKAVSLELISTEKEESATDTTRISVEPENAEKIEDVNSIIYRVQIGSFSKSLPDYIERLYKKLSVLRKIDHYTDDAGITVYTIGEISNFDDAITLQEQIRREGVKDAFVVAYNNGKRITLKEAKELTKK